MQTHISASNVESLPLSSLIPKRGERALLVGMTGSGKTTLARYLLAHRKYRVVADYKGRIDWPGYVIHKTLKSLVSATEPSLIYKPSYAETIDENVQAQFWQWCYNRGNCTVYVDETAAIVKGNNYPYHYGALLMRGREMGIELWSGTQRPKDIPMVVLSESENVYAFRLRLDQDRERVQGLTGIPAYVIADLTKQDFVFARQDGEIVGPLHLRLNDAKQ